MSDLACRLDALQKSIDGEDFLNRTLNGLRAEVAAGKRPLALFGAGDVGQALACTFELHGLPPACICDNRRAGTACGRIPVVSFVDLTAKYADSVCVISTNVERFRKEIAAQLLAAGWPRNLIVQVDPEAMEYYTRPMHLRLEVGGCMDSLSHACDLLADERSRDIFARRLVLFSMGTDFGAFQRFIRECSSLGQCPAGVSDMPNMNYYYFHNDAVPFRKDEVLVDGGAYIGDSVLAFADLAERLHRPYRRAYCFEPDAGNLATLKQATSHLSGIEYLPYGLWEDRRALHFVNSSTVRPTDCKVVRPTDEPAQPVAGQVTIEVTDIDGQLEGEKVGTIKMDIEGAEVEALRGAAKTIERCAPRLAISIYHKRADLYEIPLLIHSIRNDYAYYLRHLSTTPYDTVLFAVPKGDQ